MKNSYYTELMLQNFNKTSPLVTPLSEALGMTSREKVGGTKTNNKVDTIVTSGVNTSMEKVHVRLKPCVKTEIIDETKIVDTDLAHDNDLTATHDSTTGETEMHENNKEVEESLNDNEKIDPKIEDAVDTVVNSIINHEEDSEESNNEEESSENINLENFTIGQNVEEKEPDYSNYEVEEPQEEQNEDYKDDETNYPEYVKKIKKEKHKKQKFDKDMEDY